MEYFTLDGTKWIPIPLLGLFLLILSPEPCQVFPLWKDMLPSGTLAVTYFKSSGFTPYVSAYICRALWESFYLNDIEPLTS